MLAILKDNLEIVDGGGIRDVFFIDENIGWAVGGINTWDRLILSTSDGGNNWTPKESGITINLYSIAMYSRDTAYCVGGNAAVLKTIDGGENWVNINPRINNIHIIW